ncbi:hypothetical protein CWM58_23995 [Klebsiella sp. H-Nf2]|nr:hypothetical protein CWM58_23995 [Klebsiella sp. H-Nf2]
MQKPRRPAQAQRRRARTAGTEPLLYRAAATPCPAYITQALIHCNIKRLHRYRRPVQAQRRRATDIRHRTRPGAGKWQIRSRCLQTKARPTLSVLR